METNKKVSDLRESSDFRTPGMNMLSEEMLLVILGFCKPENLLICSRVSKQWYALSSEDSIWERFFDETWREWYNRKKMKNFQKQQQDLKRFTFHGSKIV